MVRLATAATLALALAAGAAVAAPAPKVGISDYSQLKTPLPYPYDEQTNATADLDKAIAAAKSQHKRVLVDLGANWCADCRIFAATFERPEMKAFLDKHFVVIEVDMGRWDRNQQILDRYGVKGRLKGVPAFLVVDPVSGKQLVSLDKIAELSDARNMKPQALANWIAQWTP